jgi:asparagine synthase (glutamine-hydrolysing)
MTALAGLWHFDGRPYAADGCKRMLAAQAVYGPHDSAQWAGGDVAVGRRLMRVLPEDAFDDQPIIGGKGRFVLVADVRLDNRDELTESLRIPAAQARGLCDAAILLAAIERWEEQCLEHLIGDFAFALWDDRHRRLLLARDPLGQRPLHYHRGEKFFAFASMPKGLHALADVPRAPDEIRIAEFVALMPETGTQSFFQGIERIESGHIVIVTPTGLAARQHWQPSRRRIALNGPAEYAEALRDQLDRAVHCRLRGVGDVGAQLSGGFDSAAVAVTAARLLAPTRRRVVAFTAVPRQGYNGPAPRNRIVDEGPHAAATAAQYPNMEHVLIRSHSRSPLDDLDRSFYLFDRPILNICNSVWGISICDAARERKLNILLRGSAGNMGLSYNGLELLAELFCTGKWLTWLREARALVAQGPMRWRGVLAQTLGHWCPAALWVWLNSRFTSGDVFEVGDYTALNLRHLAELDVSRRARDRGLDLVYRPWKDAFAMRLWALRRVDPGNYNKGVLGGWHIDSRDPTADVRLLEFCLAVPTEQFLSEGKQRALARRALADRVPKLVLDEPRKGLQAADWHEQLTAVRDRIKVEIDRLDTCASASKMLDLPRLRRLVETWPSGGWERDEVSVPYRLALLRGISTGHFLRRATGDNH